MSSIADAVNTRALCATEKCAQRASRSIRGRRRRVTQWTPRDAGKLTGDMKKSVKELRKTVCQMSRAGRPTVLPDAPSARRTGPRSCYGSAPKKAEVKPPFQRPGYACVFCSKNNQCRSQCIPECCNGGEARTLRTTYLRRPTLRSPDTILPSTSGGLSDKRRRKNGSSVVGGGSCAGLDHIRPARVRGYTSASCGRRGASKFACCGGFGTDAMLLDIASNLCDVHGW